MSFDEGVGGSGGGRGVKKTKDRHVGNGLVEFGGERRRLSVVFQGANYGSSPLRQGGGRVQLTRHHRWLDHQC